jgi:phosphohistidine phosphatase
MKFVYLVRHAKSSWKDADDLQDLDRPLNERGERDALKMPHLLKSRGIQLDYILSSHALRAFATAHRFATVFDYNIDEIEIQDSLYHPEIQDIWTSIQTLDNAFSQIFIFSHNPALTDFLNSFEKVQIDNLPTCGIACMVTEAIEWKFANHNNSKILWIDYPKLYM